MGEDGRWECPEPDCRVREGLACLFWWHCYWCWMWGPGDEVRWGEHVQKDGGFGG